MPGGFFGQVAFFVPTHYNEGRKTMSGREDAVKNKQQAVVQSSEALRVGLLLALAGGFLDAYTYLGRGHVFANAQTGNIVMLGVDVARGDWAGAGHYLLPILAFVAGVLLAEWIRARGKASPGGRLHWRQWVLLIELAVLAAVGFLPAAEGWNDLANVCVSFVCSLQVESFRKVHGRAYATTMCTGNLRSGTELLVQYRRTGDRTLLAHMCNYYGVILAFVVGAGISALVCEPLGTGAIWLACLVLAVVLGMLFSSEWETSGPV